MTKIPETGGRWVRDPETGALGKPGTAPPPAKPEAPEKPKAPETRKGAK